MPPQDELNKQLDKVVYESSKIAELTEMIIKLSTEKVMWQTIALSLIIVFLLFGALMFISI